ncbi:MAG: tRNA lysidine(34) synthetase TilS [Candidatus Aureabacteria bacterium]|nr:tRNA lysidine(34) synthetase TilS [Candidatus Auribacterota bacterium]
MASVSMNHDSLLDSFLSTIPIKNENVLVGYSGGVDSTVLLYCLNEEKKKFNFNLYAIHINHGLRGKESDADEIHCGKICKKWGIPFKSIQVDIKARSEQDGISLENAGRNCRRELFKEIAFKKKCSYVFLAHTLDDQIETILFRLFRGTGPYGLNGMEPMRKEGALVWCRPFLEKQKSELIHWAQARHLIWREDSSNLHMYFSRNRIRHELIPLIKSIFKDQFPSSLLRLRNISRDSLKTMLSLVPDKWKECFFVNSGTLFIDLKKMDHMKPVLFTELLRKPWFELFPDAGISDHEKIHNLYTLCHQKAQKQIVLPGQIRAWKDRHFMVISKMNTSLFKRSCAVRFTRTRDATSLPYKEAHHDFYRALLKGEKLHLSYAHDSSLLKKGFSCRYLRSGENLNTLFLDKKSLKNLFSEKKVPFCLIKSLPLIYYKKDLVLIPGVAGRNDFVKNQGALIEIEY